MQQNDSDSHAESADSDRASQIQEASAAGVRFVPPERLNCPLGRRVRQAPNEPVALSWLSQRHLWLDDGERVWLEPSAETVGMPELDRGTRWLLTGWNARGRHCSLSENDAAQAELTGQVLEHGAEVIRRVATVPPDGSWLEETLMVTGLDVWEAQELAAAAGQHAVSAWDGDVLLVLVTGPDGQQQRSARRCSLVRRARHCPMRLDDVDGARCFMWGGPYGSAAIHAASLWTSHRSLLLDWMGCDACQDGALPTLGPWGRARGAISVHDQLLPSRHGGWSWRPYEDAERPEPRPSDVVHRYADGAGDQLASGVTGLDDTTPEPPGR